MSAVYDNWERLVGATFKREELRQIALCSSFSSCSISSDFSFDPSFEDISGLEETKMAKSAASFLFNHLDIYLRQELELLRGIGKNAVYIRDELGQMREFLRAADAKEESLQRLKEWLKLVRDVQKKKVLNNSKNGSSKCVKSLRFAYQRRDTSGLNWYIQKIYASLKNLRTRHRIASEFQERFRGGKRRKDKRRSSRVLP